MKTQILEMVKKGIRTKAATECAAPGISVRKKSMAGTPKISIL
jgi:hypothetical protein